jgi:hypothetical protein
VIRALGIMDLNPAQVVASDLLEALLLILNMS